MSDHAAERLFLGLISGTSADGIDAALVQFHGAGSRARPELVFGHTYAWEPALRERLLALGQRAQTLTLDEVGALDVRIGRAFAAAAASAMAAAGVTAGDVAAIGSHGQTLRHRPHGDTPFTLQLGDANTIAERTGVNVVADFRRRDVAAGGHGAPLMPAFHLAMLGSADEDRAVLNLGGIANLSLIARDGSIRGFDTGPANALLDGWCQRHLGTAFDADGAFAASGRVDEALLARLLDDAWFALPPPKSTGRDLFHAQWLAAHMQS